MARPKYAIPDAVQGEIVADLRKMGFYVWITAALGGEILDAIVFWRGKIVPVEFKAVGSEQDLTLGEREGIRKLADVGVKAVVATCTEDVVSAFVGIMIADARFAGFEEWRRGGQRVLYDAVGEMGSQLLTDEPTYTEGSDLTNFRHGTLVEEEA